MQHRDHRKWSGSASRGGCRRWCWTELGESLVSRSRLARTLRGQARRHYSTSLMQGRTGRDRGCDQRRMRSKYVTPTTAEAGTTHGPAEAGHYVGPAEAGHYAGPAEAGHYAGPAEAGHHVRRELAPEVRWRRRECRPNDRMRFEEKRVLGQAQRTTRAARQSPMSSQSDTPRRSCCRTRSSPAKSSGLCPLAEWHAERSTSPRGSRGSRVSSDRSQACRVDWPVCRTAPVPRCVA